MKIDLNFILSEDFTKIFEEVSPKYYFEMIVSLWTASKNRNTTEHTKMSTTAVFISLLNNNCRVYFIFFFVLLLNIYFYAIK